jgi:hypothetical protein
MGHMITEDTLVQGCTNPRCQLVWVTQFCGVAPNIGGSLEQIFFHVTFLVLRILRLLLMFGKFCTAVLAYVSEPEQPKFISSKA